MVKLSVLYGQPSDPEAFERYYADTHVPIAAKIPDVQRFEASRVVATADGGEPPYHRLAELWFESQATLEAALSSPEGRDAVDDIPNFASGGAVVLISDVD